MKRKEGESRRENDREGREDRREQCERLNKCQLFSEAAEKSKCLSPFVLGWRGGESGWFDGCLCCTDTFVKCWRHKTSKCVTA